MATRMVEVRDVIDFDGELGLFGGRDMESGEKVTFHLRGEAAGQMAGLIENGEAVHVEVPE